jgi:hypothetical protein
MIFKYEITNMTDDSGRSRICRMLCALLPDRMCACLGRRISVFLDQTANRNSGERRTANARVPRGGISTTAVEMYLCGQLDLVLTI